MRRAIIMFFARLYYAKHNREWAPPLTPRFAF
jgi:hypothetical protein